MMHGDATKKALPSFPDKHATNLAAFRASEIERQGGWFKVAKPPDQFIHGK